jgi:hypothetical protein
MFSRAPFAHRMEWFASGASPRLEVCPALHGQRLLTFALTSQIPSVDTAVEKTTAGLCCFFFPKDYFPPQKGRNSERLNRSRAAKHEPLDYFAEELLRPSVFRTSTPPGHIAENTTLTFQDGLCCEAISVSAVLAQDDLHGELHLWPRGGKSPNLVALEHTRATAAERQTSLVPPAEREALWRR